jgi:hypothetical protein
VTTPILRVTAVIMLGAFTGLSTDGCATAGPAEARPVAGAHVQGGDWFVQSGCTACHPVSVYGLRTPTVNAPDLSIAVDDVQVRFGRSLEDFLGAPTGTMAMVLASRIVLDDNGRRVAISKLKEVHALHQEQSGAARPVASH